MKKQSHDNNIYLEDFRVAGAKVFTGRDRGAWVRQESKIDKLESKYETINFYIPDNIYSINPSFFEELFLNVVIKLGREKFFKKFQFFNSSNYNYEKPLEEAIERILRNKTAIG